MIGVYKSTLKSGVDNVTTSEYFTLCSYLLRYVRSFHQPPTGYTATYLDSHKSTALPIIKSECTDPTFHSQHEAHYSIKQELSTYADR